MTINITREQNDILIKLVEMAAQEMRLKAIEVFEDCMNTRATKKMVAEIYETQARELVILGAELKQAGHMEDLPVTPWANPIDLEERDTSWIDLLDDVTA